MAASLQTLSTEDLLEKLKEAGISYMSLKTKHRNSELCDRMHSSTVSLSQRFKDGFTSVVAKVLELVQRNAPLAKVYKEAREEMLAEDLPDSDFRAALILLPQIFKEKVESLITLGECDADTPYPNIQLVDWKMAFSKRVQVLVKVDGVEVCRGLGVEEGIIELQPRTDEMPPPSRNEFLTNFKENLFSFILKCREKKSHSTDRPAGNGE